jgi:hypothetical protein
MEYLVYLADVGMEYLDTGDNITSASVSQPPVLA